jgi:hypothetical protein
VRELRTVPRAGVAAGTTAMGKHTEGSRSWAYPQHAGEIVSGDMNAE